MDEIISQKLAASLTADDTDIIPYLPYLLQDLWALGSDPEEMMSIIKDHTDIGQGNKVLDLGTGKGAVAIKLAVHLKCRVKGIDIMSEFVAYARKKAEEYGVKRLCEFATEDITIAVNRERGYDAVIYGAVGEVLGDRFTTLKALAATVTERGWIVIDDAYLQQEQKEQILHCSDYPSLDEWKKLFVEAKLELVLLKDGYSEMSEDMTDYNHIKTRAEELTKAYPSKADLFQDYVKSQYNEYTDLQNNLKGAVFLLRKQ